MALVVDHAGGGVPVVCLPMLGMSRVAAEGAFGPALAGTAGPLEICLDLPGHGDSPVEGAADSRTILDTLSRWLEGHLDSLAALPGSSYGGYLAGLARERPDLVRGLLLVCPGVRTGPARRDLPPWRAPGG